MYLLFAPAFIALVLVLVLSVAPIFRFKSTPKPKRHSPTFCPAEIHALEQLAALGNTERAR